MKLDLFKCSNRMAKKLSLVPNNTKTSKLALNLFLIKPLVKRKTLIQVKIIPEVNQIHQTHSIIIEGLKFWTTSKTKTLTFNCENKIKLTTERMKSLLNCKQWKTRLPKKKWPETILLKSFRNQAMNSCLTSKEIWKK